MVVDFIKNSIVIKFKTVLAQTQKRLKSFIILRKLNSKKYLELASENFKQEI